MQIAAVVGKMETQKCTNTADGDCGTTDCGSTFPTGSNARVVRPLGNVGYSQIKSLGKRGKHGPIGASTAWLARYKAFATVTCDGGYAGGGQIECKADGKWSTMPTVRSPHHTIIRFLVLVCF